MTILILIIFPFESNQINLDLLSNDATFLKISEICCIASVLNEFKIGHCSKKCISSSISDWTSVMKFLMTDLESNMEINCAHIDFSKIILHLNLILI
jgi:hypothetical protein